MATCLLDLLNNGRRQSWIETVQELDLTHSSRKAWNLLRHLGSLAPTQYQPPKVTANEVAVRLLCNFKVSTTKEAQREVRKEMSQATRQSNCSSPISSQYTRADADKGLAVTKAKKAAGVDGIFPEFLKNLGLKLVIGWPHSLHSAT